MIHLLQSRSDLEQQSLDTANTSEAVGLITHVQALKRKMKSWEKQVDVSENDCDECDYDDKDK